MPRIKKGNMKSILKLCIIGSLGNIGAITNTIIAKINNLDLLKYLKTP
jgi:hypothetical protein